MAFARGSGPTIIIASAILLAACWLRERIPRPLGDFMLFPLLAMWGLVLYFFRDPERNIPADDTGELILAPADGQVMSIETVDEPIFIGGPAIRVSTFMSIWDVHVNRSPVKGKVTLVRHVPGKFLQAFRPEASSLETTKLGPPKQNSLAILLATMPPSAPNVRLFVNGGPHAFRNDSSQTPVSWLFNSRSVFWRHFLT